MKRSGSSNKTQLSRVKSEQPPVRKKLPKHEIVKSNDTFREIIQSGCRWHENHMTIYYKPSEFRQVGFAVSKRLGNAVVRNKAKRRMRELYRDRRQELGNMQIVMMAKKGLHSAGFQTLKSEWDHFIRKANIEKPNP